MSVATNAHSATHTDTIIDADTNAGATDFVPGTNTDVGNIRVLHMIIDKKVDEDRGCEDSLCHTSCACVIDVRDTCATQSEKTFSWRLLLCRNNNPEVSSTPEVCGPRSILDIGESQAQTIND